MGAGQLKSRGPADVLKAVGKELLGRTDVDPWDMVAIAVQRAYGEGMLAAADAVLGVIDANPVPHRDDVARYAMAVRRTVAADRRRVGLVVPPK